MIPDINAIVIVVLVANKNKLFTLVKKIQQLGIYHAVTVFKAIKVAALADQLTITSFSVSRLCKIPVDAEFQGYRDFVLVSRPPAFIYDDQDESKLMY